MTHFDDTSAGNRFDEPATAENTGPIPTPRRSAGGNQHPEAEAMLRRVLDVVSGARPMPLSSSVMINRDEVVELLEESIARLPDELRAARWLLKERDEFLAKVRREGEDILEQARARAERMVQRTEVVKAAETRARQIVERAEDQSRRMRLECEDFCDQKLASFEIVLERTQKLVAAGRSKLQGNPLTGEVPTVSRDGDQVPPAPDLSVGADGEGSMDPPAVFDQDQ
ncbi:MAG: ATP synthase F0 subunit B [Acidimicrobiales bacterium]